MIHTEELQHTKTLKSVQNLIKGDFNPDEAEEIIEHMINKKINFHECKNFSNEIRFGEKNLKSIERIQELKLSAKALKNLLYEARATNKRLRISSTISVELIES
ncbi:MAG: hypothetical protein ACFHWX_13650 [Bacteroidota bacterium]